MEHTRFVKLREEPAGWRRPRPGSTRSGASPKRPTVPAWRRAWLARGAPVVPGGRGERILGGLGGDCKRLPPRRTSPPMCAPCTWRRTPAARASPGVAGAGLPGHGPAGVPHLYLLTDHTPPFTSATAGSTCALCGATARPKTAGCTSTGKQKNN